MAINKNFVVKNGLEVSTNLIFADANINKVGIGSTIPRTELDVRGGIAATDLNITGVATIATLRATTGIVTNFDGVNLNVSGIGTFASIDINAGDLEVANLDAIDINVTGIATIADLNATGISTLANVDINAGDIEVTSVRTSNLNATGVSTIASLSVTGSTFDTLTVNNFSNLSGITTIDNAIVTNLDVTGIATLGTVQVSSGIITAASGIVTYYGDGAYLQNLSAGIGIGTTGGLVGYGATFINFYGPGVSTALYDSSVGIATIYFEGGGGGATVSIGTEAPTSPTSGDLWYNNNEGRIFIYYDEVAEGIGSAQVWVDAAPFNVGIITSLNNVSFEPGSAISPSMYFVGDTQTGFFSPTTGETTFVSAGSSVLNINASGLDVTGVVTATTFDGNATTATTATNATGLSGTPDITVGVVTATSFSGDGSGLTGVASTDNIVTSTPAQFLNNVFVTGITTLSNVVVGGATTELVVNGDARITGILTIGTSSITLDGVNDNVNVGTAVTIIGSTGQIQATSFVGDLTGTASTATAAGTAYGLTGSPDIIVGNVTGTAATFTGNVSIAGTLTYDDVTNVDSIGLVTARTGVRVTAGGLVVTAGISTLSDGLNVSDYLREEVNITAGKLSDNTNIDLENGMVHLFTTTETTTSTPNIRYSSSESLDSKMSVGQSVVVTLITTAAAGAYSANITIDGSAVTENWIGGSAPSDGGSSGVDIHTFTIIKTASATFTVIGNQSKTS